MRRYLPALLLPLIVIAVTAAIIVGIGSLLLAVGKVAAVPTALGIALAVLAISTFVATRGQETEQR